MGNTNVKIPAKCRRLVLSEANSDIEKVKIEVETIDTPKPRSGQVLIKVCAAVVNPSDYGEWLRDQTNVKGKPIGKEGSGIVVASEGIINTISVGQRVGFVSLPKSQGAYSEYVVADAMKSVFPIPDSVPIEDAAAFFVNPYTVMGLLDSAKEAGSKGLIHTAAASSLGKMMVKYCKKAKIPLVNVVRREEQAKLLRDLGAEHVVVTSGDDKSKWLSEIKELAQKLKITVAADAVGGEMSGDLLSVLPFGGTTFVYGGLSKQRVSNVDPLDLIYRRKKLKGWFLPTWLQDGGVMNMLMRIRKASSKVNEGLGNNGWSSTKFHDVSMKDMFSEFKDMYSKSGFTNRKLRILMDTTTNTPPTTTTTSSDDVSVDGDVEPKKEEEQKESLLR
jgi:NADPH:quinone reductase